MFRNFLKIALRNLKRFWSYSIINLLGLSFGFALSGLLALWIIHQYKIDDFHSNRDEIYQVVTQYKRTNGISHSAPTPRPLAPVLISDFPEIINATRVVNIPVKLDLKYGEKIFSEDKAICLDSSFFSIFSFPLVSGNPDEILKNPTDLILSRSAAFKYFGNEDPIGKTLLVSGQFPSQVTGVFEDLPSNSQFQFDLAFSFELMNMISPEYNNWQSSGSLTFIQTIANTNSDILAAKLKNVVKDHVKGDYNQTLHLLPLKDVYFDQLYSLQHGNKGNKKQVYILILVATLILAIAGINFVNLSTAQASQRNREIGVKKVMGATGRDIVFQFIAESFLLTTASALLAIELISIGLPLMERLLKTEIFAHWFNPVFLMLFPTVVILLSVLAAFYPAAIQSTTKITTTLKEQVQTGKNKLTLERTLVMVQMALSIILIIGTLTIFRQMNFISNRDLGFAKDQLLIIEGKPGFSCHFAGFKEEIRQYPEIEGVSCIELFPKIFENKTTSIDWPGKSPETSISVAYHYVDPDFMKVMGIDILEGRDFSSELNSDYEQAFIINETALSRIGLADPIGKEFSCFGEKGIIIGIAKDSQFHSLHERPVPRIFRTVKSPDSYPQTSVGGVVVIRYAANQLNGAMKRIESFWKEYDIQSTFEIQHVDQIYFQLYEKERRLRTVFSIFSILSILISCIGILALNSFYTQRKAKEIAIRKINGANMAEVLLTILSHLIRGIIISLLIAIPVAWFLLDNWLENFAYKASLSWWIFALAGVASLGITLVTVSMQTYRAATRNPVEALRYE